MRIPAGGLTQIDVWSAHLRADPLWTGRAPSFRKRYGVVPSLCVI